MGLSGGRGDNTIDIVVILLRCGDDQSEDEILAPTANSPEAV
jgi:hypothetical protein